MVTCKQCKGSVPHLEFISGGHNCPLSIPPRTGESWDDYQTRSEAWRTMVHKMAADEGKDPRVVGLHLKSQSSPERN